MLKLINKETISKQNKIINYSEVFYSVSWSWKQFIITNFDTLD
jgi:hypothetical protein